MASEPTIPAPTGTRAGEQIESRYRLLRLLGIGGMGEVYEAEHLQVGKRVAVKLLSHAYSREPDQIARFEREARVASIVTSPHIVDVMDAGSLADGTRYFVMELLRGVTLARELEACGPLPIARACGLARQIAAGLSAAHAAGIIHRDLKPDNVFLVAQPDRTDRVKILDFGVSKVRHADISVELTRTGMAIGTPMYMSPEQSEGARDVDARADIWSLGVILFRMLTGQPPFSAPNYARLMIKIVTEAPPRPRSIRADLPSELERIVLRCLEKETNDRYASAADFIAAIEAFEANIAGGITLDEPIEAGAVPPDVDPMPTTLTDSAPSRDRSPRPPTPAPVPPSRIDWLPFDEVVLGGPNGRRVTAAAFFDLPLSERIQQVISRTVTFVRGGVEVDRQEALAKMRLRASRSP